MKSEDETARLEDQRRERFERLVMPELPVLYRVAVRLCGRAGAEDAVQEAMLRAWRYFDTFESGRRVRPWLMTILRNVIFEGGRRSKRRLKTASLDAFGADNVVAAGGGPIREELTDEEVLAALDALPARYREVVVLTLVEGFKYREVAEALDIPVGTVMSRLHRGRNLLRYHLGEYARREGLAAG